MEKLLGRHPSHPYNPDIANTFFWSGDIEAWGRGIQRIQAACRAAVTPEPRIEVESRDVWIEFPFSENYLASISGGTSTVSGGTTQKTTVKTTEKTTEKSGEKTRVKTEKIPVGPTAIAIMQAMQHNPTITIAELAGNLNRSTSAIEKQVAKLRDLEHIRRVGPDKGGYWEVLE
jgi:ATP-dependent DNA helicase RecG